MKKKRITVRTAILVFLTHKLALPLLKKMRRPHSFTWSREQLKQLPAGSLGNDLYWFLENRNLPLLPHYARHDLKHVLLNYDTTDEGETCLQSFMLGNGRVSFPVLGTVIYGFITMPEYWGKMKKAFRAGKKCRPVHGWHWNNLLNEQTITLRNILFNQT